MMTFATGNKAILLHQREHGFSLMELIVVIFIVSLVMAVSYPSLSRGAATLHLRSTGRDVLNTFRFAREKAITEQTGMVLTIDKDRQEIVLSNDLGENVRKYVLPSNIKIRSVAQADHEVLAGLLTIRFFPNGSSENAQVLLMSENGSLLRIIADPFSGGARVESVQGE